MREATPTRRDILALGGLTLTGGIAGCSSPISTTARSDEPNVDAATNQSDSTEASGEPDDTDTPDGYSEVYEQTRDSVVLVETDGQGTGFMYDDSHIVTNAHVVGRARRGAVRFAAGGWSAAEVVGSDPHSDLAVLKAGSVPSSATPLSFIDSEPAVGQRVLAIGNPYNLNGTMTSGIISGVDRSIPAPTGFDIPDAIQTDAPVNPGNSGGPLVDLDGEVVAVINSGGGDNIGFGISAALTQRVVPELIETGEYEHAYMGLSFEAVTPTVAQANGLDEARGLLVARVADGGPSDGVIQPSERLELLNGQRVAVGGDVIRAIDGNPVNTTQQLGSYLALETQPGETVTVTVHRDETEQTVSLELGRRPLRP